MADALPTKINLTVVTRERKIIDIEVDEVVLPASDGEIGVLPGHTPLLTTLKIGQKVKVVFKPTDGAPLPFFTVV